MFFRRFWILFAAMAICFGGLAIDAVAADDAKLKEGVTRLLDIGWEPSPQARKDAGGAVRATQRHLPDGAARALTPTCWCLCGSGRTRTPSAYCGII